MVGADAGYVGEPQKFGLWLTFPFMMHWGDGAAAADTASSNSACAETGTLVAPTPGWSDRDGPWPSSDIRRNTLQMKKPLALPVAVFGAALSLPPGIGVTEIARL
jgi:hypothetical protein